MSAPRDPDERVSLDGLTPEEALRALLAVKPEGGKATDEADAADRPDDSR